MATTLTTQTLVDSNRRTVIKIVGSGGGDSNASLVVAANLAFATNATGVISKVNPKRLNRVSIKRVWGQGGLKDGRAILKWQGTNTHSNTEICTFHDSMFDYNFASMGSQGSIPIEDVANSTGNIVLSLDGNNLNDSFTLFLELHKDGRDYDQGQTADPAAFNFGLYDGTH